MLIPLYLFLLNTLYAKPTMYAEAVTLYHQGAVTEALSMFEAASISRDSQTRKKALYMSGAIQAARGKWDLSTNYFEKLQETYPEDSYADDAQYWLAKVRYLKCDTEWNACSSEERNALWQYFSMVYNDYPQGDMAPHAYYMTIRLASDNTIQLFTDLLYKYPNHSIIDDAFHKIYTWKKDKELETLYRRLQTSPPNAEKGIATCRIALIKGMIAMNLSSIPDSERSRLFEESSKCSERSDIYKDSYQYWVASLNNSNDFPKAIEVAEQFKERYLSKPTPNLTADTTFYLYLLSKIAYQVFYGENSQSPWYKNCSENSIQYSWKAYQACTTAEKTFNPGWQYPSYGYRYRYGCSNNFQRYYFCSYYLNNISAEDLLVLSRSKHIPPTNWITLMYISADKKDRTGIELFKSKITYQYLSQSEKDSYDNAIKAFNQ
jgi:hypothetical protein